MSIIRVNKNQNYTVMSNHHFKEKEMSLKAKGLLSQMLSLPDNWDYSISGLVAINKENETSIKNTLDELKDFGYLKVTKLLPNETETGRIEYIYDIYEEPQKQEGEKQGVENLGVEFQGVENQGQYNTNNKILNINTCSSYNNKEVFEMFEKNLGRLLSPLEIEKIQEWSKDFDIELIEEALRISLLNNKKNLNYIGAILRNWKTQGYKTKQDIEDNTIKQESKFEVTPEMIAASKYDWLNTDWF